MAEPSTDDTRAVLAGLMGMPVDDVLHYAIVVQVPGGMMAHQFCGMPRDGIMLHGAAVQSLAWGMVDMEASKLAAGCTACRDEAAGK